MSSSIDNNGPSPTTPPVVKTKTLMGDQSVGGTVYIRPRPETEAIFSDVDGTAPTAAAPKDLAITFAASDTHPGQSTTSTETENGRTSTLKDPPAVSNASAVLGAASAKSSASDPSGRTQSIGSSVSFKDGGEEAIDEELKMAEALALAIQSNPNMSPEEIKLLIGVKPSVKVEVPDPAKSNTAAHQAQQPQSLQALAEKQQQAISAAGQKLTSMFQAAVDNSSENAKKATSQGQETFKAFSKSLSNFKPPVAINWASGSSTSNIKVDEPAALASRETSAAFSVASVESVAESVPAALKRPSTAAGEAVTDPSSDISGLGLKPTKFERARMSGLAWKRRGGMGKYTSSAWELRRFELRGTKLLYFSEKGGEAYKSTDGGRDTDDAAIDMSNSYDESEGVYAAKRSTWLEQAAATWNAVSSDPSSPRGDLDLAKEKAVVQISYGHSGAPSPFALSIKVNGDTKWKLCFARHKTLMEWLAALSDVVVQCSVDHYNANLLAAADPSYQGDVSAALLPPPAVHKPPAVGTEKDVNRLWMCEKYTIGNADENIKVHGENDTIAGEDLSDGDLDISSRPVGVLEYNETHVDAAVVADHSAVRAIAEDTSEKAWSVPEHNLRWLAVLVNAALFLARSSSVPVEGFWYIFVVTNVGFYLCLVKEPSWRSLLLHVKASTSSARATVANPIARRQSAKPGVAAGPVTIKVLPAKPIAGTTTVKLKEPKDPPVNAANEIFAGWRPVPGETVLVRSHGYNSTKAKIGSPGELYELVSVDIFESPQRYPDMATRVTLPKCDFDDGGKPKTWRSPDIFVISIALPTDPPSAFAKTSSDGGGYTITMYYRMHQDTRDILRRVTADGYDPSQEKVSDPQKSKVNAARLLEEWVRRAPSDPKYQARFKVVTNAHNLEEIGMPSWISKYNGKPFLVKRAGVTGFLYTHPELSCVEFDVSLHAFPYICKQAISFMKDSYFKKVLVTFGFTIEGRTDDELPECLIGSMQLCYPDPAYAIQADKFFAGTAPKSF